ncbi:ABC transporter substrate-binding protein [Auraticoccus monumenti]|uniref:Carbohydrate ABC transporter substrate-binding protein, CUT1 family n=1 Tax=Auraticoccus monumenti TaxID=675864 RepID=A0A1G6XI66_9ACTN|nr:extracellular solute-binding protein [Auraticoccus monumenti]SDD77752.1 carbohydrate ABC transporter substrate-binding protein, CUT1 family [Auraticoccus monumenti]
MGNNRGFELSRRGLLGAAGGLSAGAVLAACQSGGGEGGGGGGGSTEPISFWNMPWGNDEFNPTDEEIVTGYVPADGLPTATYQTVQWANFTQTFSSAVASQTGPAVSSGGGTQAFLFEEQGAIAYADDLLESWKGNGLYEDFLPGLIDTMQTERGYAAVPYNLDMRVLWVNPTLLEEAGTEAPTDWQSFLDACEALKAIDVYGYGDGSGSGRFTGGHILVSWMIGNGGGLFNAEQQPDCVTPANIEAMEFVLECVSKGYVDPASATYTSDNVQEQWRARRFGMGFDGAGLAANIGGEVGEEIVVNSPLTSPAGVQGMLYFPNNIMMYQDTPSQEGSEAFVTYYYQNMARLWTEGTGIGLPPLISITETPEFQEDANNVKIISEYQPIARTWAAPGGAALFQGVTSVDATPIIDTFTQSILTGATDARSALEALQAGIQDAITR